MIIRQEGNRAYSWDLDDTLIGRERITRGLGVINAKIKPHKLPTLNLDDIPDVVRETVDEPLRGISERISFAIHARRRVIPSVQGVLDRAKTDGIAHYGNTGRPNKRLWVDMTHATLERGEIAHFFEGIFFTPEGMKTVISKVAGIKELKKHYPKVDHFEDDPRTAVYIATIFPNVTVHLIQYGSSGLLYSRQETDRFPNIRRVGIIQDIKSR